MSSHAKYESVTLAMRQDLEAARERGETKFLTDKEATERYGVSRITARRAFARLEQEGLIERLRGRGTLINPNPGKRIRFVAFMGECLVRNGIEPMIIKGMEECLLAHDTNLIICNMEDDPLRARQYAERLVQTGIDGIVFTPMLSGMQHNEAIASYLLERRVPMVLVGRSIPSLSGRLPAIVADNYQGGREATEHLLSLGHRRVAFFRSIAEGRCSSLDERQRGYREALRDAGLTPDGSLEGYCQPAELPLLVRRWQSHPQPPTAVFVDNDITMVRFMEAAKACGIRVPQDLSLIGFDDLPQISPIPQSTIHVPHQEIGQMAASLLVESIREPNPDLRSTRDTLVPIRLVIRKTTGIPANARRSTVGGDATSSPGTAAAR